MTFKNDISWMKARGEKKNLSWYNQILMPTATRKAQLVRSGRDTVAGLRINHRRASRSWLTTVLPAVTFNIIHLHRKRKKRIFYLVAVVYPLKSDFFFFVLLNGCCESCIISTLPYFSLLCTAALRGITSRLHMFKF